MRALDPLSAVNGLNMPGGVVLTGGNAALPRMVDYAKTILGENVRLFIPDQIGLRHPSYTRAMSYAMFASRENMTQQVIKQVIMSHREDSNSMESVPAAPKQAHDYVETSESTDQPLYNYGGDQDDQPRQGIFSRLIQTIKNLFRED